MKSTIQIACSNEQGEGKCQARLAQSVERQALNLVVGGSSPPVGVLLLFLILMFCGLLFSLSRFTSMFQLELDSVTIQTNNATYHSYYETFRLDHSLDELSNQNLMVTVITTLVEVEQLLAEASVGARQLEGPQEVGALLEVGSHGVDLVDQVVHRQDAELAQHLLHLLVLHQRHTLLVQLRVATLVHQHAHRLQVRVSVGDVRLHQTQHLLRGLVQTHEHGVVDLAQTQQLQGLAHLGRGLVDTTNTDHDRQTTLALNEHVSLSVSLSSLGDQIGLHLDITAVF